ncbi:MAG TPA: hypothetical protein VHC96_23380 [Puia sp.]|nr:hypothetical protein [Puia sp.]
MNNSSIAIRKTGTMDPLRLFRRAYDLLTHGWMFIPIILYYREVSKNLTNIPVMDDYVIPLDYVMKFSKAGFWQRLSMIFGQVQEHRLVPSKLIYLSYYYLTGEINFRTLGLLGDLQLLGVAYAGVHFIKKYASAAWQIPAFIWILVVFDLNTYENAAMCMNGVGNYGVVCYFLLTLYFYDRSDKWIPLAVLFQFFTIFSNGNGLPGGVFLVLFNLSQSRRKRIVSIVTTCALTAWYLATFHSVDLPDKTPYRIDNVCMYFIRQSGAHFSFDYSFITGCLVLISLACMVPWRRLLRQEFRPILCILLFIVSTMVLTALFRACYTYARFNTSRYMIYPQMLTGMLCLLVWTRLRTPSRKWIGGSLLLALMLFAYAGNYQFGRAGLIRTNLRATTRQYWFPEPARAERITKEACESNIYCIEDNRVIELR